MTSEEQKRRDELADKYAWPSPLSNTADERSQSRYLGFIAGFNAAKSEDESRIKESNGLLFMIEQERDRLIDTREKLSAEVAALRRQIEVARFALDNINDQHVLAIMEPERKAFNICGALALAALREIDELRAKGGGE